MQPRQARDHRPGDPRRRRRAARAARRGALAFLGGALLVGPAWAGVGLVPVGTDGGSDGAPTASPQAQQMAESIQGDPAGGLTAPDLSHLTTRLPEGEFLVGADVTSLTPDAGRWQREGCVKMDQSLAQAGVDHLTGVSAGEIPAGWPKSDDCVYLGGYGIPGPARPATGVDPHAGVNVRSIAISNGVDTVVWQMVDMVGYFNTYRDDLCADCGILDIRRAIADGTGGRVPADNVAIGSTHTHGGADGYGVWAGLPTWYRHQVRDAIIAGAYSSLAGMRPARLEIGSVDARAFNRERRDLYHSTADYGAVWLQARALPVPGETAGPDTIATLVNYAAHPVVLGAQPLLHGDWPATAAKALGESLGGVGLVFEGGLGNVSPARAPDREVDLTGDGRYDDYDRVIEMGDDFAAFIAADVERGGVEVEANDIVTTTVDIEHPVTNWAETALGLTTLLDREFMPTEEGGAPGGAYTWSKHGASPERGCSTAGPTGIRTQVSGFRIGTLTAITAPGEIFSNMSEVVKSKARAAALEGGQTMVFGQTQDSLGYIIQSFEVDPAGGVATNAPGHKHAEYEETFMLDRCFGDHVLDAQLGLIDDLG